MQLKNPTDLTSLQVHNFLGFLLMDESYDVWEKNSITHQLNFRRHKEVVNFLFADYPNFLGEIVYTLPEITERENMQRLQEQ